MDNLTPDNVRKMIAKTNHTNNTPAAPAGVHVVTPRPAPMSIQMAVVHGMDSKQLVMLKVQNAFGEAIYFLEPDIAEALGKALIEKGGLARSGLVVPN